MIGDHWYYDGGDGRLFCFSKAPSYSCANADVLERERTGDDVVVSLKPDRAEDLTSAAATLAIGDPRTLGRLLEQAHSRGGNIVDGLRDRRDGELTDFCRVCGRKLRRLGFATWVETDVPADQAHDPGVLRSLGAAFGGSDRAYRRSPITYRRTKREAKEWAYERSREAKSKAAAS